MDRHGGWLRQRLHPGPLPRLTFHSRVSDPSVEAMAPPHGGEGGNGPMATAPRAIGGTDMEVLSARWDPNLGVGPTLRAA